MLMKLLLKLLPVMKLLFVLLKVLPVLLHLHKEEDRARIILDISRETVSGNEGGFVLCVCGLNCSSLRW